VKSGGVLQSSWALGIGLALASAIAGVLLASLLAAIAGALLASLLAASTAGVPLTSGGAGDTGVALLASGAAETAAVPNGSLDCDSGLEGCLLRPVALGPREGAADLEASGLPEELKEFSQSSAYSNSDTLDMPVKPIRAPLSCPVVEVEVSSAPCAEIPTPAGGALLPSPC